jgi:hypothetical protein
LGLGLGLRACRARVWVRSRVGVRAASSSSSTFYYYYYYYYYSTFCIWR